MSKQNKKKKSDVADAAFKKKVTMINGCILLAFVIGLVGFLIFTMIQEDSYPERFQAEIDSAIEAAKDKNSDKSIIDIDITDETFVDWIFTINSSYGGHHSHDESGEEEHDGSELPEACFDGNTIRLQGVFEVYPLAGGGEEYWVYRKYLDVSGGENKVPARVVFEGDAPEDGSWVEVTGILTSNNGLCCIKDAEITTLDIKDKKEFVK